MNDRVNTYKPTPSSLLTPAACKDPFIVKSVARLQIVLFDLASHWRLSATMPRPPRAKVALSTGRVAKPKPAPRKQPAKTATTQTTKINEAATDFSDDSDGLVTTLKSMRPRRKIPSDQPSGSANEAEVAMTGALPAEEKISTQSARDRTPTKSASKRTRNARGATSATTKTSSPAIAPTQTDLALGDEREDISQLEDSSGFGDLTFSSLGSNSPAHGTRPPSAMKVGATPAHERSILALTNFKRRARQPSLLRMVQQTTDVEDNDHDSLDNTDNFDFDDFLPHAESTPLNTRRNAPEIDVRNDSGTQISSSGSRGTKRKLSPVVQVPRSSPPFSPPSGEDVESTRSLSPSLPDVSPSRETVVEQTQEDPELMSETFAPPLSSSPIREASRPPKSPAQTGRPRRGRAVKTSTRDEDSEAEETEAPAKSRRGARKVSQQGISTAQLKDLLPRRRNRRRDYDEFDLNSSDEVEEVDSDQDELQMPNQRSRQRAGTAKLNSLKAIKKRTRGKKTVQSKAAHRVSKTYSRRISSDKENERANQEEEGTTEVSAIEHSEKLAAIRKKFEEVDAFELEFETVDTTTSSSPFR